MKKIVFAAALVVSGLLVGCNQLTQYTVSEQEINQALEKHNNFSKDIGVPGLADAHIVLTNLTSQIGREEPNKVTLAGDADLDMSSLFGNQKANIKLKLKALPVFHKRERGNFPAGDGSRRCAGVAGQDGTGSANLDALSEPVAAKLL